MYCTLTLQYHIDNNTFNNITFGSITFGSITFGSITFGSITFDSITFCLLNYIVKVTVNIYTFLLLIYLPIIMCFIWMYVSVCRCDIQDKVILFSYTYILNICTITLISNPYIWKNKNHTISDYN